MSATAYQFPEAGEVLQGDAVWSEVAQRLEAFMTPNYAEALAEWKLAAHSLTQATA